MNEHYIQTGSFRIPTDSDYIELISPRDNFQEVAREENLVCSVKNSIINWIKSLKVAGFSIQEFPENCSDGILLMKIANKLEINSKDIKFYDKKPLKNTEKRINIKKF